jgi:NAD(P)-dependent dehydrogenase (short-subunit alcohol dehydrogenase family)
MSPPPRMNGEICVVTGANSGIGKETALGLVEMGAHVVMVCRSRAKGQAAVDEICGRTGSGRAPDLLFADMSSQKAVRALAEAIRNKYSRVDVLVNNAGAAVRDRKLSVDGIEMTVATNHLGAALLTVLLLDLLKEGAPSRIVNVSSEAQRRSRLDMNDLQFERRTYSGFAAYGQSKLLMNAFTFELARRLAGTGVTANCLHPGVVATNIWGADPSLFFKAIVGMMRPFMLNSKDGAALSLYLASSPDVAQTTGEYFVKSKPAPPNPLARDVKVADEIWRWTHKMIATSLT